MNRKERIHQMISKNFPNAKFIVDNFSYEHHGHDHAHLESHYKIIFDKSTLGNLSKIDLHRQVNKLLADEFSTGLHALSIQVG